MDFPSIGAVVSMAALVGRKIGIRPKRHDDWLVVPNLWGGVIGRPGIMKTPALEESMLPLKRLNVEALEDYSRAENDWETAKIVKQAQADVLKKDLRAALKNNREIRDITAELTTLAGDEEKPRAKRLIVNDSTVEKLQEILQANPNGTLVFRDELVGWLRTLDREGRENDRAFYLEAWNGTGGYVCDRIGRGTTYIEEVCLSILGGIQPGPLAEYVREASKNGSGADGLLQRFQLLVWPDDPGDWRNVDRWPDTPAKNRAFEVFKTLDGLDPFTIGAKQEREEGIPFLRFTDEAQEAFDAWRETLEKEKLRSGEPDMIEAALSKYRSLIPSLALLFHLADVGTGLVGLDSLLRAFDWSDYLESHMRRIYGAVGNPALSAAHSLLRKIREGKVTDGMTLREIYLKGWSGLDRESLPEALQVLDEYGWAKSETRRPETPDGRGRESKIIRVNPKIGGAN
jgi:putative DNA primase/helicase